MSLDSKIISEIDVTNFIASLPTLLKYFENRIRFFRAGALKDYLSNWQSVTSDTDTLQTVAGVPIELSSYSGLPDNGGHCSFSSDEVIILEKEIDKLIDRGCCIFK